eukprot:4064744-Amphidinium_carterae.1
MIQTRLPSCCELASSYADLPPHSIHLEATSSSLQSKTQRLKPCRVLLGGHLSMRVHACVSLQAAHSSRVQGVCIYLHTGVTQLTELREAPLPMSAAQQRPKPVILQLSQLEAPLSRTVKDRDREAPSSLSSCSSKLDNSRLDSYLYPLSPERT